MLNSFYKELAKNITISSSDIEKIEQESTEVVYVFRRKSIFESRLWNQVCKHLGLKAGKVLYL